ncbi:hypothetical protein ACQZWC_004822, partial [Enterobacter bugandensis]
MIALYLKKNKLTRRIKSLSMPEGCHSRVMLITAWLTLFTQIAFPVAVAFTPFMVRAASSPCELAFHEAGRYPAGCGFEPVSRDDTRRTAVQGGDARLAAGARTLGGMLSEGHAGDAAAGMARSMASGAANDAV